MNEDSDEDNNVEIANISDKKSTFKSNKNSEHKKLINESETYKKIRSHKYNYIWKKIRNTYVISVDEEGNPVLTVGPEWIYYILLTLSFTCGFLFLFIRFYQFIPNYLFISGIIVYFIFITVYTKLFITEPGFPKKIDKKLVIKSRKNYLYCYVCDHWVPKKQKIKHCKRCGMCIEGYDHHCEWIGKCVGSKNFMGFFIFIVWVVMVVLYFIASFVIVHNNWFEYQKKLRYDNMQN